VIPKLSIRLARTETDIEAAQRLRYEVFFEELKAQASDVARATRRDADAFDPICDHLMVERDDGFLVGTYRLLRQDVAERHNGFYSAQEFDIAPLLQRHSNLRFLELGRSCVLRDYRTKPVLDLLWQGIWDYVRAHRLDVMFGCASFEGSDPKAHTAALSFLHHHARDDGPWRVKARPELYQPMYDDGTEVLSERAALRALPPLVKGYLRLGCKIGEGCVIDHQFNTVDVLIVLPVSLINPRYFSHYGEFSLSEKIREIPAEALVASAAMLR
jgi:L-ornithine Nalpha-acyltransferase